MTVGRSAATVSSGEGFSFGPPMARAPSALRRGRKGLRSSGRSSPAVSFGSMAEDGAAAGVGVVAATSFDSGARGVSGGGDINRSLPVSCRELDPATVKAELVRSRCNIAGAARALGVPASDLRRLVAWGPLAAAVTEQVEQAIDRAEAVLLDGLELGHALVRLKAASALLTLSPPADVALKWLDN